MEKKILTKSDILNIAFDEFWKLIYVMLINTHVSLLSTGHKSIYSHSKDFVWCTCNTSPGK